MWRGEPSSSNDWGVVMAYRLRAGDTGPVQQAPVTCGSACLTVARMLVDPLFASWIRTGAPRLPGSPAGDTENERFAAYERVVMRRTNGLFAGGLRPNVPWPHRLGTPPWGARRELQSARPGAARGTRSTCATDDEAELVGPSTRSSTSSPRASRRCSTSATPLSPRHVVLVLPGDGDRMLDVYDPATGRVGHLRRDTVVERRLGLSGWDVPWVAVRPTGPAHGAVAGVCRGAGAAPA